MTVEKDSNGYLREKGNRKYDGYIHVQAAEKKLGRKLGKSEVVHHVDENKENNDPDNLLVLRSEKDHRLIHSKMDVEVVHLKDGSTVVIKDQKTCPNCQRPFEPNKYDDIHCSVGCVIATQINRSHIPDMETLRQMVWSKPAEQVAVDFGVSGVTIKNWCDKLGIEKPGRGYWAKKKAEE